MTKETWGGSRPGSGRKPVEPEDKRVQMVISIDKDTKEKLKAKAKKEGVKVGRIIDRMMDCESEK